MAEEGKDWTSTSNGIMEYYGVLRDNRRFRILWIGELVNQAGNWFSYVAALTKVEELSGNTGFLLSLVLVVHFLPNLIFFPVTGVVADRFPREKTLLYSCACAAVTSALIPLIQNVRDLWLLYVLLFLQYSAGGFYDPARRALQPTLVPDKHLGLAATLDTFAWSLMSALGGSLGGYAVSAIGITGCFLLDCLTYIVASGCAQLLINTREPQESGSTLAGRPLESASVKKRKDFELSRVEPERRPAAVMVDVSPISLRESCCDFAHQDPSPRSVAECVAFEEDSEAQNLLPSEGRPHGLAHDPHGVPGMDPEAAPDPWWRLLLRSFVTEVAALREGWVYIGQKRNRDVAALISIKAGGSLIWGASDLFNVHFAAMPQMQTLGDQSMTLGFIFSSVGVGCFFGPIFFNYFTPTRRLPLLVSTAVGYAFMLLSYLVMAVAPNVWIVLLSTAVRAVGSATTWIYSTLLLQLRVPNALLGRMLALEMAAFTACECVSGLFGGAVFDVLHWSVQEAVLFMSAVAAGVTLIFCLYVTAVARGGGSTEYDVLAGTDSDDGEDTLPEMTGPGA